MGHSKRCGDLTTRWNREVSKCESCEFKPGREITPNCGYDDEGGRHESPSRPCSAGTFNDGSRAYCQPCTPCPPGFSTVTPCNSTTDTLCRDLRYQTKDVSHEENTTPNSVPAFFSRTSTTETNQGSSLAPNPTTKPPVLYAHPPAVMWAVPLVILICIMLALLSACVIYVKRRRGQQTVLSYHRKSSYVNAGFSSLSAQPGNDDLEDFLSPLILSAPLETVLDNLDVLEELVILLDPECHGVKNTKHLASHCSFPSTWITYTYSMKDSKSPLKTVLEGVTSRHPEWTVGHLAKILKLMERNDAIAVLAKLPQNEMDV